MIKKEVMEKTGTLLRCFTISVLLSFSHMSLAFVPGLLEHGREMVGLIEKARKCKVEYRPGTQMMSFCSGLILKKDDLKFLSKLDMNSCNQFLKQRGYRVFTLKNQKTAIDSLSSETVKEFFNSTKLAWMLHKEKQILFKTNAKRGDCLHEVLHFYQRERKTSSPLAPLNRKKSEARLQELLERAVVKVEKVEKKGNKAKASEMASQIQPFIALQREWQKMINWLDEKEIYQAFFDYHDVFFKGPKGRDWDIALANLVRLKDSLAWDLRERVLYEAQQALNQKYASVPVPRVVTGNKTEEHYGRLYNQGKITREDFEEKVIGLRKYRASQGAGRARQKGDLLATLVARARLRNFDKEKREALENPSFDIEYKTYKELPMVLVEGEPFIIDTGASESILPPKLLKSLREQDILLLGSKVLQTVVGRSEAAPIVQVLKPLHIAGKKYKGLTFVVSKLPTEGISGILGMDFFKRVNDGHWYWRPQEKKLGAKRNAQGKVKGKEKDKGRNTAIKRVLLPNGRGLVDALEFRCGETKVRLDSGSQVLGDIPRGRSQGRPYLKCEKELGLSQKDHQKLLKAPAASALFSREVGLNLGHEFLMRLKSLVINLPKREVSWERGD